MLEFGALLVAQSDTEPQVPIWLQILALALAPVLGFMGIGVGALLQSRSSRKAKLRDDRRTTYLAFAKEVHDFYQWFGIEGIKSADHRPGVDPKRHLKDVSDQIGRIQALSYEVDLVASSRAAVACGGCVKEVLVSQVIWAEATTSDSFNRTIWSRCYHDGSAALRDFRDAAMRDLGLSRRDRRRLEIRVADSADINRTHDLVRRMFPGMLPDPPETEQRPGRGHDANS